MGKVTTRNWTVPEEWRAKRRCTTAAGTVVTVLILIVIFNATTTAASKSLPNTNNNSRGMLKLKLFQFQAKSTVLFELEFLFCKKKRCQINRRIRRPSSSLRLNCRRNLTSSSSYNWTSSCLFVFSFFFLENKKHSITPEYSSITSDLSQPKDRHSLHNLKSFFQIKSLQSTIRSYSNQTKLTTIIH